MNFDVISPTTTKELLKEVTSYQRKNFRFGAGYTDLLMEFRKNPPQDVTVINLAKLKDENFTAIAKATSQIRIGALVTANSIVANKTIQKNFTVLHEAAEHLASSQIRQVATVGGNLCTASPSGDIACALMALQAKCEILSATGKLRTISIQDFFTGPRKTVLKKNEVLRSVVISTASKNKVHSGFIKIGTRLSMECSVISLAYHIQSDKKGVITDAGIAIGSVAPTIRFTQSACDLLIGKKYSEIDKDIFSKKILDYASPISDIRASAWYRKEVLKNVSKTMLEQK